MSASPLSIPSPSRLTKRKLYCGAVYFLFVLLIYDLIPPPLPPPLQVLKEFWAASGPTVVCYCVPSKRLSRQGEWKKEKKTLLQGHTSFCFPRCLCCWLLALVLGIHSPAFACRGGGGRGGFGHVPLWLTWFFLVCTFLVRVLWFSGLFAAYTRGGALWIWLVPVVGGKGKAFALGKKIGYCPCYWVKEYLFAAATW